MSHQIKSCRQQAAHLQLLSEVTNSFRCALLFHTHTHLIESQANDQLLPGLFINMTIVCFAATGVAKLKCTVQQQQFAIANHQFYCVVIVVIKIVRAMFYFCLSLLKNIFSLSSQGRKIFFRTVSHQPTTLTTSRKDNCMTQLNSINPVSKNVAHHQRSQGLWSLTLH